MTDPRERFRDGANLPEPGERLVFGVHRLPARERVTPAWPSGKSIERSRVDRFRAWVRRSS